ncbi:MAG TPA: prepilin-type N-terminal cleavage/methylation domain-containing protein [Solirubrobacteraceae bacterium]|jgi:Tfp pilus assembly protein PilV|nr:prepilin-type N-terminal cleavage/methylation domain-containing protein [Solirubrobacteraceae bacterium]
MRRHEDGFTMIEVIVAAFCLGLIIVAVATLFVTGNRSSLAGERQAALIAVADQQIEFIRSEVKTKGFDALAMSSAPTTAASSTLSSDANVQLNPDYFAPASSGCGPSNQGYAIETNYDNTTEGAPTGTPTWSGCTNASFSVIEPLEILTGGFVPPGPTTVTVGSETATVDTYVTDSYVGCTSTLGGCPTLSSNSVSGCTFPTATTSSTTCADARRVIVAVVPNASARQGAAQNSPVYISTVFTNPTPSNMPTNSIGLTLGDSIG